MNDHDTNMKQNDITMNGITMVCQPVSISEPALFFFGQCQGSPKPKVNRQSHPNRPNRKQEEEPSSCHVWVCEMVLIAETHGEGLLYREIAQTQNLYSSKEV